MRRRIKVFLSLIYTMIFVVLASTGVLHIQAAEHEFLPTDLHLLIEPVLIEFEHFKGEN